MRCYAAASDCAQFCEIGCVEMSCAPAPHRLVRAARSASVVQPPGMSTATAHEPTGLAHAYLLDGRGGGVQLDWSAVERWTPADGVLWLNLDYSEADSQRWLEHHSNIAPLSRDALLDLDPRPRAVPHGDELLLIIRAINLNEGAEPEDMLSIRGWIDAHRVVTLRRRKSRSLKTIAAELDAGTGPTSAGALTALVVERVLEYIVTRVDVLDDAIAACEDQVVTETRGELRAQLAEHRRRAIALRRFLAPQREALAKLSQIQLPWLDASARTRIVDAADRMTRTVEELDAARDRAAVTQEELQSKIGEITSQRLYVLSVMTAVFLPLGFVCALLGVNVGGVPLQHDSWAFWALCGTFAVGVAAQIWFFRRRGWFGG
jgi:zinc transporter